MSEALTYRKESSRAFADASPGGSSFSAMSERNRLRAHPLTECEIGETTLDCEHPCSEVSHVDVCVADAPWRKASRQPVEVGCFRCLCSHEAH